jgi:predicted DNA-binding transcriptional regulator YafY
MNRIDRLLGIITLLQSRKYITAEKIAHKFGISIRTVYRDIKALDEQGIPVSFEPHKGYFVVQGYFLPPISFYPEEANALLLVETIVSGFADKSILTHYSNALNKVRAVLPASHKEKLDALKSNIRMQIPPCIKNDLEHLSLLQHAICSQFVIEITYSNQSQQTSKRHIEPIGLIFYALSWHLIAWCHTREDYRDFKVSRIIHIKNTEKPFTKSDHIPLNDYMKMLPVAY